MKQRNTHPTLPVHDYSYALSNAVSWLGDRYLLAVPVEPRRNSRQSPAFFLEPDPWFSIDKPGD